MVAVVFTVDAHTATGHAAISSEEMLEDARKHGDVLIPFASVDPHDRGRSNGFARSFGQAPGG